MIKFFNSFSFWMIYLLLLLSSINFFQLSSSLSYDIVNASQKPCPGRDSCNKTLLPRGSNRGPIEKIDWKKRNCFCDLDCSKYGDCCVDALAEEDRESSKEFSCVNLKQYGNVYVKNFCPTRNSKLFQDFQQACEGMNQSDPVGNTPVTSMTTGFTYKNYYCALCHGDSNSIRFWKSRLECPTITGYSDRFRNISKKYVEERLEIRGEQWGLEIDTGGIGVFHRCQVDPAVPDELSHYIRPCPGQNLIQSCPSGYSNETVSKYCTSFTGVINVGNVKYKNPYCASCHNVTLKQMTCFNLGPLGRFHWTKNFNTYSFAVLFDISGIGSVGMKCETNTQVYDPYFKKCRNVICEDEKSVYINGKCIQRNESSATTEQSLTPSDSIPLTSPVTTSTTPIHTEIENEIIITTSPSSTLEASNNIQSKSTIVYSNNSLTTSDTTNHSENHSTTTSLTQSIQNNSSYLSAESDDWEITTTIYETTEYFLLDEILSNETSPGDNFDEKEGSSTLLEETTTQIFIETNHTLELDSFDKDFEIFSDCPKIVLSSDEFRVLPNKSIFIPKYQKIFDNEDIDSTNESITICIPENENSEYYSDETETKFGSYMSYISLVCLGISVICLMLHLIASLISPELQNLNGKNLFSLSLSLLGGYASFIAGMLMTTDGIGCRILSLIMYFFFLSSFVWMFIISFDICRSLMRATSELRFTSGSQWKKFILYSLFGWSVPLLCGTIAALADFNISSILSAWLVRPGFGEAGLCWFSSKKALLLYFALPFGIIATGNLGFFIWSACLVYNTTKDVSIRRLNYHLYLRLGVLMGLTWIVGLVAGFLDFEVLWIVFIVFNTLQGLFIFLAFTCTKKVVKSIRNSFPSSTESFMFSSSNSSGGSRVPKSQYQYSSSNLHRKASNDYPGKTMYMVQPPKHNSLSTSNSFNKRYF
uniref:G-protein coupled receptors family 2 profile 2 domain-containing protein n=1 Tax=Lepeophtheirus salmonis TaxID=72036 RepID=A0A0K2TT31_LEPSM